MPSEDLVFPPLNPSILTPCFYGVLLIRLQMLFNFNQGQKIKFYYSSWGFSFSKVANASKQTKKSQLAYLFRLLKNNVFNLVETIDQILMEGIKFCSLY
jgi:hypothetical protein